MDDVLEAFRTCITDRKCQNRDCPYESRCNICNNKSQYLQIPKHLALDVERMLVELLKEQPDIVRCKDCIKYPMCCLPPRADPDWFCADGVKKE